MAGVGPGTRTPAKGQEPLVTDEIRDPLYSFLSGVLGSIDCAVVEMGGMPDHIHLLTAMSVNISLDDYLETVKSRSEAWVNEQFPSEVPFAWQEGSAAFSDGMTSEVGGRSKRAA